MPLDVYNSAVQLTSQLTRMQKGGPCSFKQAGERRLPLLTAWKTALFQMPGSLTSATPRILGTHEESAISHTDLAAQPLLKTHTNL